METNINYHDYSLPFRALRQFCEEGKSLPPPVPLFVALPDGGGDRLLGQAALTDRGNLIFWPYLPAPLRHEDAPGGELVDHCTLVLRDNSNRAHLTFLKADGSLCHGRNRRVPPSETLDGRVWLSMLIRWGALAEQDTAPEARLRMPGHLAPEFRRTEILQYSGCFRQNLLSLCVPPLDEASGDYLAFELSVLNDGTGASDPMPGDSAEMPSLANMTGCIQGYRAREQDVGVTAFSVGEARLVAKTRCPPGHLDCDVVFGVAWYG